MYDLVIVGSGLFGATFANLATGCGLRVMVLDKRPHLGGNCYTENKDGIEVHKYGPHIFHTTDKTTWQYVQQFSAFSAYTHRTQANVGGRLYSFPVNLNTIQAFYPEVAGAEDAERLLRSFAGSRPAENLEEFLVGRVGETLYKAFYQGYSRKQWGRDPKHLPASIGQRIPVRTDADDRYFSHPYQGIPVAGYTAMVRSMLRGAELRLSTDYFKNKGFFDSLASTVLYTGALDHYFGDRFGKLEYRSLGFEEFTLETERAQPCAIVNYCDEAIPYTRITEHKHFSGVRTPHTVITREYPGRGKEEFYPVNDLKNNALYARYSCLAAREENVLFGGRLAEYKYFDMDHVIQSATRKFRRFRENGFRK